METIEGHARESPENFDNGLFEELGVDVQRLREILKLKSVGESVSDKEEAGLLQEIKNKLDMGLLEEGFKRGDKFLDTIVILTALSEIENFRKISVDLIEANYDLTESRIDKKKLLYNYHCLKAFNVLVSQGNYKQMELGLSLLWRHLESLEASIGHEGWLLYASIIKTLADFGSREEHAELLEFLEGKIVNPSSGKIIDYKLLAWCLLESYTPLPDLAKKILMPRIAAVGLNPQKTISAWESSTEAVSFKLGSAIEDNFIIINELESFKIGTAKFLNDKFGIYDFGRYPAKILKRQAEKYDDNENPYGVIFYPRSDWNGAFYQDYMIFEDLFGQLKSAYELRVFEGEGKLDIIKTLRRLNKKYGKKHKISFVIIGGHGNPGNIQFGGEDPKHSLRATDLFHNPFNEKHSASAAKYSRFFEPEPTLILASCETGVPEGIGQRLSKEMSEAAQTSVTVIAPDVPTNLESIRPDVKDGQIKFEVKYVGSSQTYTAGKRE